MTVWLVLPLIATILLRIFAKDGWKETGLKLSVKGNVRFYISSICIFPIVTLIVCFVGYALGWIYISNFKGTEFIKVFAGMFLFNLFKNFFEESVWRGYLTEKLMHFKIKASRNIHISKENNCNDKDIATKGENCYENGL